MYRNRLEELRKEKGLSHKRWSEESGVSLDTIARITHSDCPEKDSAKVNTLEDLCKPLGVELWEIFYEGDRSLVHSPTKINFLEAERNLMAAENEMLKAKNAALTTEIELLKKEIIHNEELLALHSYYKAHIEKMTKYIDQLK